MSRLGRNSSFSIHRRDHLDRRTMPIAGLMLLAQVLCAVHAGRTGRPSYWIMLILFMPGIGLLAYFLIEIVPDLSRSRSARAAASGVVNLLDPEKGYREALRQVQIASTTGNKAVLAEQCLRSGRVDEAVDLHRGPLTGLHATGPDPIHRRARRPFKHT